MAIWVYYNLNSLNLFIACCDSKAGGVREQIMYDTLTD